MMFHVSMGGLFFRWGASFLSGGGSHMGGIGSGGGGGGGFEKNRKMGGGCTHYVKPCTLKPLQR